MLKRKEIPEELIRALSYNMEEGKIHWNKKALDELGMRFNPGWVGHVGTNRYLNVNWKGNCYLVHRVIWAMFNPTIPDYLDHIDGDRLNNRLDNLRECTQSENISWANKLREKIRLGFS